MDRSYKRIISMSKNTSLFSDIAGAQHLSNEETQLVAGGFGFFKATSTWCLNIFGFKICIPTSWKWTWA